MNAKVSAGHPIGVCHQPCIDIAAPGVEPRDIACSISIEVADAGGRPSARARAQVDGAVPLPIPDLPDLGLARVWIEPEHITGAVVVEVACTGQLVSRRMAA